MSEGPEPQLARYLHSGASTFFAPRQGAAAYVRAHLAAAAAGRRRTVDLAAIREAVRTADAARARRAVISSDRATQRSAAARVP